MSPSRTLYIGLDVPQAFMAVAAVAREHDAAIIDLGTMGTGHGDIDTLVRNLQAKATQRLVVDEAGPCGDWRSRSLRTNGHDWRVVAPSLTIEEMQPIANRH